MQVEEARQKQERAEELRVKKEEQETKKQKKAEAKIEADAKRNEDAENMPDKERAKLLVELKKNWKEANRHYEQQKTNESHDDIATVRREQLSDRMVDIAKELTGEDIIGDALALSGCDPSGPKDDKQREAFRRQLTKNVEAIFDEQVKKLPEKYRKKAKAPDGRKIITNQRRSPAERLAVKNNPAMIAEREQRDLRRKWDAWLRETLLATGATTTQELFDRFEKGEISLDEGDKDDPEIMENVRQFLLLKLEEEKAQDEKIKIK